MLTHFHKSPFHPPPPNLFFPSLALARALRYRVSTCTFSMNGGRRPRETYLAWVSSLSSPLFPAMKPPTQPYLQRLVHFPPPQYDSNRLVCLSSWNYEEARPPSVSFLAQGSRYPLAAPQFICSSALGQGPFVVSQKGYFIRLRRRSLHFFPFFLFSLGHLSFTFFPTSVALRCRPLKAW